MGRFLISVPRGFAGFLARQTRDLRSAGRRALAYKLRRLVHYGVMIAMLPFTLPALLVIRLAKPWKLVRFSHLNSDRIGHFALNTEFYLCERDAGMHPSNALDIFYNVKPVANQQLKLMWDRVLNVRPWARHIYHLNSLLPGGQPHIVPIRTIEDPHGLLERFPCHLSFTPAENQRGKDGLPAMGLDAATPFVCLHVRDSAYLDRIRPQAKGFWNYHDHRDADIKKCVPAALELARRGLVILRMGSVVQEPFETGHPRILDYATHFRSDFMDMYLPAHCRFYLGTTAGIGVVPGVFRLPIVRFNLIPLELAVLTNPRDLIIPKKLWRRKEKRFMTFRELRTTGAGAFCRGEQYAPFDIEFVENTPEEILDVAVEMDERLNGTWNTAEEDEALKMRFKSIYGPGHHYHTRPPSIGAKFLRQNTYLLD